MNAQVCRIFVGTSPNGEDDVQEKILEYSLRKHASMPLEIIWMRNNNDPDNFFGNFTNQRWATPFSGLRWTIPEYCEFKGRAIYMDVDQLSLRDICELYNIDMQGKAIACVGGRTCIMVMDCEKCKEYFPPVETMRKDPNMHGRMYSLARSNIPRLSIDSRWNSLDGQSHKVDEIYHLHFTRMNTQPWKPAWFKGKHAEHPRKDILALWNQYKAEASSTV
jgi:hypothetical protein